MCLSIWCNQIFYHMQLHFPGMIFSICGINLMPSIILISRKRICQLHRSNGMVWQRRASISRLLPVISLVHPLLSLFCEQLCCGCICCFHHFFLCGLCLFLWCCKGGIRSFHCREIIDFVIVIPVFFFLRRNHDRELVFLSDFCGFFLYPQA